MRAALFAVAVAEFCSSPPLLAATRTWTGTTNGPWTLGSNRSGVAPVAGDDLVFPAGAANTTNNNDFAPATAFGSITIQGAYALSADNALLPAVPADWQPAGSP